MGPPPMIAALTPRRVMASPIVARLGVILILLAIWEVAARWFVDPLFLAPPSWVVTAIDNQTLLTKATPSNVPSRPCLRRGSARKWPTKL